MKTKSEIFSKLKKLILENATHLKVGDLTISDRAKLDASMKPESDVQVLYKNPEIKVGSQCKFYGKFPYKPLPNAIQYKIGLSAYNWLSALFGVPKRMYKHGGLIINWRNNEANKYIRYRFNHLGWLRDEGKSREYWRQAALLLKSRPFQVMALNHVIGAWQTNRKMDEVNSIMEEVKHIVEERKYEIQSRRVYIPKPGSNKFRPLGVPTLSWRIYLHMWYCIIVWYRMGTDKNHAYIPGKGTHTAWEELIDRIQTEQNVYEFDLTQFFPSVNLAEMERIMISELGFPRYIAKYLTKLNRSITTLCKEDKLNEDNDRKVFLTPSGKVNPNLEEEMRKKIEDEMSRDNFKIDDLKSILPNSEWKIYRTHGVPQGAGTSCSLSTISLWYVFKRLKDIVTMFADDGICFPKKAEDIKYINDKKRGVKQNSDKSSWFKKNGNQIEDSIKFLGLELTIDRATNEVSIKAATRNGSKLAFTEEVSLLVYLDRKWNQIKEKFNEGESYKEEINYGYDMKGVSKEIHIKEKEKEDQVIDKTDSELEKLDMSQTIQEWLSTSIDEYKNMNSFDKVKLLFKPEGMDKLAQMMNGSWGVFQYKTIKKYAWGSWYHQNGSAWLYREILDNWRELLTIEFWNRAERSKISFNCEEPYDIWRYNSEKASLMVKEDQVEKATILHKKMTDWWIILNEWEDKKEFSDTLNSLFKWNNQVSKEKVVPELRQVMAMLLYNPPISQEGMRTIATADVLQNGFNKEQKIRGCHGLKRSWKLVGYIKPSVSKVEGKLLNLKKFRKEVGWSSKVNILIK